MKRLKKICAFIMAIVLVVSGFTINSDSVMAEETREAKISVESLYAKPGTNVVVKVSIKDNPGILGAVLKVSFDDKNMTLVKAESGEAFSALTFTAPGKFGESNTFSWDGQDISENDIADGEILKLTFKISDNAIIGDCYNVKVTYNSSDIVDSNLNIVKLTSENGEINILNYIPGDLNDDGKINSTDVISLRRHIVGKYDQTIIEDAGDVNADGRWNSTDVIMIRRYIAGGYNVKLKAAGSEHMHTMSKVEKVDATCTEDGNITYWYCSDCGKYFKDNAGQEEITLEDTIIQKKGHTVVVYKAVPATTESTGLTEGSHCSVCGKVLKEQTVIPKTEGYSITYNITNGDKYLAQQEIANSNPKEYYKEHEKIVLKGLQAPDGYRFLGWYDGAGSNATQIKEIKEDTTGNIELYAHWEEVVYDVTYKLYQTPLAPISDEKYLKYTVSKGLADLPNPTLYNYIFLGWYDKDGNEVNEIPVGTTGNIELNAYWTSKRNLTKKVSKLEDPVIVENPDNGVVYFTYEIGTIENVPLSDAIWTIQSVAGLAQQTSKTVTTSISDEQAKNIMNSVSQATVDSKTWTLSSDWNDSTTVNESWAETNGMTQEEAITKARTSSNTFSLTSSNGGSRTDTKNDGTTTIKYNSKNKTTESGSDTKKETGSQYDIGVNLKYNREKSATIKIPEVGDIGGKSGFEIGGNFDYEKYEKNTTTKYGKKTTNSHTGSDKTTLDTHVGTDVSTWNNSATSSSTQTDSESRTVSNVLSKVISNTKSYGKNYSYGGSNSEAQGLSSTSSESTNTSSTLSYSKSDTTTTTTTYSTDGKSEGCYRLVIAGTVHVFAVVGYDVATKSYFTYTYNVMDDKTYEFLDYSPNLKFNDCENGAIPFEVPIYVKDYVESRIVKTNGLVFRTNSEDGTAKVVKYDGDDQDVVIPCYVSAGKKSYKVTEIDSSAFKGKDIHAIALSDYVDEIPDSAFENCSKLEMISGYFTQIGNNAFKGCTSLTDFSVSSDIIKIGSNAFEGVKHVSVTALDSVVAMGLAKEKYPELSEDNEEDLEKLKTEAQSISKTLIESVLKSGMKNLSLDISTMIDGTELQLDVPNLEKFELNGGGKTYKNLSINSQAVKTIIKKVNISESKKVPLDISSDELELEEVTAKNDGFVLLLERNSTKVTLIRDNKFTSTNNKAIVCKNPIFESKITDDTLGILEVDGNIYVCGEITGRSNIDLKKGQIITISEDEFDKYIKGVFTISFDANGGTVEEQSKTTYYGEKVGDLPTPKRNDCEFAGWYTTEGQKVTEDSNFEYANDIKLKAHWYSDWIEAENLPDDGKITDTKWTYDLITKTTSSSPTLEGYTLYDTTWEWGAYGNWSGWSDTKANSSDSRKVETRQVVASTNYKNKYNYYRYAANYSGGVSCYQYYAAGGCTNYYEYSFDSELGGKYSHDGHAAFKWYYNGSNWSPLYQKTPFITQEVVSYNYKTQYRYADRSKVYTYHFTKTDRLESSTEVTESESINNIKKMIKYTVE